MKILFFAWRSVVRQPARSGLGILGVAAVGALLFDMLLLSQGLIVSMRDLLDQTGYDVRVTTTEDLPRTAPRLPDGAATAEAFERLPAVRAALALRFADVAIERASGAPVTATFEGVSGTSRSWTVTRGQDVAPGAVVISGATAAAAGLQPGDRIRVQPSCDDEQQALPPATLTVSGIARFPFELTDEHSVGGLLTTLDEACAGRGAGTADMVLVASSGDADAAVAAITRARPDLRAATNRQMLGRIERGNFSYFRQISSVLTAVTVSFALLLITVLLTVSVNQRLGEIAALRALGLSRRRVVADVLCESALLVGIGGLLSLPLGLAMASVLDRILRQLPNIPVALHFFVFQRSALAVHAALLASTALLAALYPMRIVATLPIATTLRNEVVS